MALLSTVATYAVEARAAVRARGDAVRDGSMGATLAGIGKWLSAGTIARRPDPVERITRTLLWDDPAVHAAIWPVVAEIDLLDALGAVWCPALVLTCADGVSTPSAAAGAIAGRIAGAELVILPGGAHLSTVDQPGAVTAALREHLAAASRSPVE